MKMMYSSWLSLHITIPFTVRVQNFSSNATHCTTRITMYTYCTYCCHNTEIDSQDFKFSVFKNF